MNVAPTYSADDDGMRPLGSSARNRWSVSETRADLVRHPTPPRPITVQADGKVITLDLARTAIIIVDMQNDFCHPDGWLGHLGVTTLMFAGINADQCVLCTLQDANFRGYDCLLLEDCAATTSPDYCLAATLYNVRQCFGFVVRSQAIVAELAGRERPAPMAAGS